MQNCMEQYRAKLAYINAGQTLQFFTRDLELRKAF